MTPRVILQSEQAHAQQKLIDISACSSQQRTLKVMVMEMLPLGKNGDNCDTLIVTGM
jgi:hypothetical protein